MVRRIDVSPSPKQVYWSESGSQVVLALEENYYLLNFDADVVETYLQQKDPSAPVDEDDGGCEEAF